MSKPVSPVIIGRDDILETVAARDQPEYLPLPCIRFDDGTTLFRYEFDEEEVAEIARTRSVYFEMQTFGGPITPTVTPTVASVAPPEWLVAQLDATPRRERPQLKVKPDGQFPSRVVFELVAPGADPETVNAVFVEIADNAEFMRAPQPVKVAGQLVPALAIDAHSIPWPAGKPFYVRVCLGYTNAPSGAWSDPADYTFTAMPGGAPATAGGNGHAAQAERPRILFDLDKDPPPMGTCPQHMGMTLHIAGPPPANDEQRCRYCAASLKRADGGWYAEGEAVIVTADIVRTEAGEQVTPTGNFELQLNTEGGRELIRMYVEKRDRQYWQTIEGSAAPPPPSGGE